jgi:hypothetical protein
MAVIPFLEDVETVNRTRPATSLRKRIPHVRSPRTTHRRANRRAGYARMSALPFVKLRHVSKSYGFGSPRREVLNDLNLDIARGEFVAIVGYSGSGKTTLISLLAGLNRPDAGSVQMDGHEITGPSPERGLVFQNYSLLPWLTVFENVALAVDQLFPNWSKEKRQANSPRKKPTRLIERAFALAAVSPEAWLPCRRRTIPVRCFEDSRGLEHIQNEVMAFVVGLSGVVEVVPILVEHRDALLRPIPVVQVVVATLRSLEVVRVIQERVVHEPIPIGRLPPSSGFRGWTVDVHHGEQRRAENSQN